MQTDHAIALAALIFVIVASGLTGAAIDRAWIRDPCPVASIETPAHAVRQGDGSLVVARDPAGKPALPAPRRPAGTRSARVVEVTVPGGQPVPLERATGAAACQSYSCPDVTVRLDLVTEQTGHRRVIATASTGPVVGGIDIPTEPALVTPVRRWAAGYERDEDGRQGAFVERDVGRIRLGASLVGDAVSARVGWRW